MKIEKGIGIALIAGTSLAWAADGLVTLPSSHTVDQTVQRLETILRDKGIAIVESVDHAAAASKAGLTLRPTRLIMFGNPKAGTPLMNCSQTIAIDLPQKALIWQDAQGKVWLSYNDPGYLAERHGTGACGGAVQQNADALRGVASDATGGDRVSAK
jgi:uncharacterized protein (DUF302 family)